MNAFTEVLPGGNHTSMVIRRGVQLELADIEGGGNVGMLLYNPTNPLERLNLPDTLKCQHTFRLTAGHCLYSDMGRIFCSIIKDDVGWHDAASGTCNASSVAARWGASSYQASRNEFLKNGRDSFLIELGKYGLGRRDMAGNINWFSRVDADADGNTTLAPGNSVAGSTVTLRFEMDTLVIWHTCPHPLETTTVYPRKPIRYALSLAAPVAEDDLCRTSRPENQRGFENTALYNLGQR